MPYLFRPRRLRVDKQAPNETTLALLERFDAMAASVETAQDMRLRDLRAPLRQVPRAQRGVEWTERVVIAYCLKRQRSARVRSLRGDIIRYWEMRDAPEKALDFAQRVDRALGGNNPNKGAYFIQFAKCDGAAIAEELRDMIAALQDQGLTVFVNSGTLLGGVRDGAFIGHDDDIDLGVVLDVTNPGDAGRELVALFNRLRGALACKIKTSFNSPVLKISLPSDITVDLFPVWIQEEQLYIWPHTFGALNRADLFPLSTVSIDDIPMPAPANPEKMLALNYGENWRVPDADFRFPWEEARRRFGALLRSYWRAVRLNAILMKLKLR